MVKDVNIDARALAPSLWPSLIACAAAALWVDFGTIHREHHGDSLLHVLISLYRWTPFIWEQDRFGMLVPLLASPIKHPLANLLVQEFLCGFCGLSVFYLLARYLLRDATYPAVATLGAAGFLGLTPSYFRFEYLLNTSYGVGLCLGLAGLIVAEPRPGGLTWRRRASALALIVLAHWVNCGTALFLSPLVLLRAVPRFPRRPAPRRGWPEAGGDRVLEALRRMFEPEAVHSSLLLALGYAAGMQLMTLSPHAQTSMSQLPRDAWPTEWRLLARHLGEALTPPYWPMLWGLEVVLGVAWLTVPGLRRRSGVAWRSAAAAAATALAIALLMGTLVWVRLNDHHFRYLLPSVILGQLAFAAPAVAPLILAARPVPGRAAMPIAAVSTLLLASAARDGMPSLAGVRRIIDQRCGAMTAELIDARCTHLAGDYWSVWPAIFHVNLALRERGESRVVWGVTFRASPTFPLWKGMPDEERCVAIPVCDPLGESWLGAYQFPRLVEVERRTKVRVLRVERPHRPLSSRRKEDRP